ncbi:MAG: hypothetical protein LBC73_02980, partial [Oscillospiraceae bacterium]|nr:hypothetical protein [Oscillospiraceae bacterium]
MENKTVADFLSNNSYNYIVDIRNGVFHKKNSHCLNKISVDSWHGTGSNPMKNDYTPCPKCFGKPHKKNEDTSTYNNTNMQYSTEHRLIDGNYSYRNNIIARCHYINHRGYLTKNLIKKHKCIEKSCSLFEKLQPKYWIALEDIEQAKKSKRADRKAMKQLRNDRDVFIRETLEDSGCAYITSIKENPNLIEIIYIYDK